MSPNKSTMSPPKKKINNVTKFKRYQEFVKKIKKYQESNHTRHIVAQCI